MAEEDLKPLSQQATQTPPRGHLMAFNLMPQNFLHRRVDKNKCKITKISMEQDRIPRRRNTLSVGGDTIWK